MRVVNDFASKTDEGTPRRGFMASGLTPFGAMPRIDFICANGLFRRHLGNIAQLESGRIFCRHGIDHLLDVARIMWIKNLEEELGFDREVIYATALLHDIGKDEQYESGISHDVASASLMRFLVACPKTWRLSRQMPQPLRQPFWAIESCA